MTKASSLRALFLSVGLMSGAPAALGDGLAGPYLAALQATYHGDYVAAARYFGQAAEEDPENALLLQSAVINAVIAGQFDAAADRARVLLNIDPEAQLAELILATEAIRSEDFDRAAELLERDEGEEGNPLLDGLLRAWIEAGRGNTAAAEGIFDALVQDRNFGMLAQYHKALVMALVGNFDGALELLEGDESGPLRVNRAAIRVHAEVLLQLDRVDDAKALIEAEAADARIAPEFEDILAAIEAGETVPFAYVRDAKDGAAEVLLTLATALGQQEAERFALVYARLAQAIRPDYVDAHLFTADVFEAQEQYDLAIADFERIPSTSSASRTAEIGRANALARNDQRDAAIEVLKALSNRLPEDDFVLVALGDLYRRGDRFEDAAGAYTRAIALIDTPTPADWRTYYVRGIAHERMGAWEKAEADFRQSLSLSPDQPLVLNYLGYSLVEMNLKIDEAKSMIERAVAGDPGNGYITDSLGWVLYKTGDYEAAVPHMERAAELLPNDPIINDHLGDVLWKVGRKTEAVFQWKRALSFEPEEDEAERIRRKLDVGLDVVLEEEAASRAGVGR